MSKPFSRSRVSLAVSAALSVTVVLGAGVRNVAAQQAERVTVTGTNIPRAQTETASPILVINRDEIEKSGKSTIAEYLQTLSVDGQGSIPPTFGSGFAAGGLGLSLRGLGASSTLTLLNGRRVAPYGLADDGQKVFTDLSTIPLEAVERVEILKDGASSIYGSDAIAGVVNIILRNSFTGTVGKASFGRSQEGDGDDGKASITHGFGNLKSDGYNVFFNFEIQKKNAIMLSDRANRDWIGKGDLRPWGYDLTAGQFVAGYIVPGNATSSPTGSVRNPATGNYQSLPGCASYSSITPPDPEGGCLWEVTRFRDMTPEENAYNLFGRGTWQLSGGMQAYGEFTYSKKEFEFGQNPTGTSGAWGYPGGPVNASSGAGAVVLAASHPDNPLA